MNTDKIYAEAIANEYSVKNTSKVVQLKKLDKKVKTPPLALALTLGIVATLILGVGMCLALGALGNGGTSLIVAGSFIGSLGIAGAVANYFIYGKFLQKRKQKYAGDIITLANSISEAE